LKEEPFPAGKEMSQRFYTIRKAFLIPLGLDVVLLFCLLLMSLVMKGDAVEKLVLTFFSLPALYLFLECFLRRVTVSEEGLFIRKLGRGKALSWVEITHVGCLILHKKIYLLFTTVKGFFIISNAFERFSALVEEVVAHVEPEKVEEEVRLQAGCSMRGIPHIVSAWFEAAFMAVIILMKMFPFKV
jgi:hypothetical protein